MRTGVFPDSPIHHPSSPDVALTTVRLRWHASHALRLGQGYRILIRCYGLKFSQPRHAMPRARLRERERERTQNKKRQRQIKTSKHAARNLPTVPHRLKKEGWMNTKGQQNSVCSHGSTPLQLGFSGTAPQGQQQGFGRPPSNEMPACKSHPVRTS